MKDSNHLSDEVIDVISNLTEIFKKKTELIERKKYYEHKIEMINESHTQNNEKERECISILKAHGFTYGNIQAHLPFNYQDNRFNQNNVSQTSSLSPEQINILLQQLLNNNNYQNVSKQENITSPQQPHYQQSPLLPTSHHLPPTHQNLQILPSSYDISSNMQFNQSEYNKNMYNFPQPKHSPTSYGKNDFSPTSNSSSISTYVNRHLF